MEHTAALIEKSHMGDKLAREQLVEENTGLFWCVVKKFYGRGVEAEDLFQIGSIGLLKAIERFDKSYQVKFSTYAVPMILGEIKRFLRDDGMIKVSRSYKELAYKAVREKERYIEQNGTEPDILQLAGILQVEKEELAAAMDSVNEVESLHKLVYQSDGKEITLSDQISTEISEQEMIVDRMFIADIMRGLKKEERQLIYLRYFAEKTQRETGEIMHISQVQVSRMEKKILDCIRKENSVILH